MKATITTKFYDNGIAIVCTDDDGNEAKLVSLERSKIESIGQVIWDLIEKSMDKGLYDEMTMEIEFEPS